MLQRRSYTWDGLATGFNPDSLAQKFTIWVGNKSRNICMFAQWLCFIFLLLFSLAAYLAISFYWTYITYAQESIAKPSLKEEIFAPQYSSALTLFLANPANTSVNIAIVWCLYLFAAFSLKLLVYFYPQQRARIRVIRYVLTAQNAKFKCSFLYITVKFLFSLLCRRFLRENKYIHTNQRSVWNSFFNDRGPFLRDLDGAPEELADFKMWLGSDQKKEWLGKQFLIVLLGSLVSVGIFASMPIVFTWQIIELRSVEPGASSSRDLFYMIIPIVLTLLVFAYLATVIPQFANIESISLLRWFAPLDSWTLNSRRDSYSAWGSWCRSYCLKLAFIKWRRKMNLPPLTDKEMHELIVIKFVNRRINEWLQI